MDQYNGANQADFSIHTSENIVIRVSIYVYRCIGVWVVDISGGMCMVWYCVVCI